MRQAVLQSRAKARARLEWIARKLLEWARAEREAAAEAQIEALWFTSAPS